MKRRYIKDAIWGDIEIMPWEHPLFSTIPLNRLHLVTQNASAFRVYPSLRHSRFSHSVGVMHIAGLMFSNLLRNLAPNFDSNGNLKKPKEPTDHASSLDALDDEIRSLEKIVRLGKRFAKVDEIEIEMMSRFLDSGLGTNAPKRYILAQASVRLAGLIHDIGHLPYSHTSEKALTKLLENPNMLGIHPVIKQITSEVNKARVPYIDRKWALHEYLGERIISQMISNQSKLGLNDHITLLLKHAKAIVFSDDYPILRSLVSGIIDSDRVDYVKRDCITSGFLNSSVDYSRIFHSMGLVVIKREESRTIQPDLDQGKLDPKSRVRITPRTIISPTIRAAADIEKLLRERFLAYKHIYSHHRVLLQDEIVQRTVIHLARTGDLDWLFDTMKLLAVDHSQEESLGPSALTKIFIELGTKMDDGWLEGKIREQWLGHLSRFLLADSARGIEGKWIEEIIYHITKDKSEFVSGYKNQELFWKEFGDLIQKPHSPHDRRGRVFHQNQITLQKSITAIELGLYERENLLCIIADQSEPPTLGADSDFLAIMGLSRSCSSLLEESAQTPLFNFWYRVDSNSRKKEPSLASTLRRRVVKEIRNVLKKERGIPLEPI